jgi:alkanesulfonate monooxygenase SsuD/methylene tetrahydromethanopterin reductase-like flavin-dependent oxidoreductase (luciferase family)
MKKVGFLSFGHWTPSSQSQTRSAADTLLQSIDLAVAAEELGADGAYFRVHNPSLRSRVRELSLGERYPNRRTPSPVAL